MEVAPTVAESMNRDERKLMLTKEIKRADAMAPAYESELLAKPATIIVQPQDNLFDIASIAGISVMDLARYNNLRPILARARLNLHPGQILYIPSRSLDRLPRWTRPKNRDTNSPLEWPSHRDPAPTPRRRTHIARRPAPLSTETSAAARANSRSRSPVLSVSAAAASRSRRSSRHGRGRRRRRPVSARANPPARLYSLHNHYNVQSRASSPRASKKRSRSASAFRALPIPPSARIPFRTRRRHARPARVHRAREVDETSTVVFVRARRLARAASTHRARRPVLASPRG